MYERIETRNTQKQQEIEEASAMDDFLYRGVLQPYQVRVSYGLTTSVVREAILAHNTDPVASHILARALTAGVLISPLLAEDERFTVRWNYQGEVKSIVMDVDNHSHIRGFIAPKDLIERVQTKEELYGEGGQISVTKSTSTGILNSGTTEAFLLDTVEDLSYFFSVSDQVETALVAMVGFNADPQNPVRLSQGIMIQALPECDMEIFDKLRQGMQLEKVRGLLALEPEVDNHFEYVFKAMLEVLEEPVFDLRLHDAEPPRFQCNCSWTKIRDVVSVLPEDELTAIIKSDEILSVDCRFCSKQYELTPEELQDILEEKKKAEVRDRQASDEG
jgi:molecular chaperone Hsp33